MAQQQNSQNVLFHQCYATPYDKEVGKLTSQMLSVNTKSIQCQFSHRGACLEVYIGKDSKEENNRKQRSAQDKRKMLARTRNWGTTDDLQSNSYQNLKDIEFEELLYSNSLIDSKMTHVIDSGDEFAVKRMNANLQNWHSKNKNRNGTEKDTFKLEDKSFWGEIFSSDSSETEDDLGLTGDLLYGNKMHSKSSHKKKKKHGDRSAALQNKYKNKSKHGLHKKGRMRRKHRNGGGSNNDKSIDLAKEFGTDFGKKIGIKHNKYGNNKKKVSFGRNKNNNINNNDNEEPIRSISLHGKDRRSVFINDEELDGLDTSGLERQISQETNNTTVRNKLPDRKARGSQYLPASKENILQRKSSTFRENPHAETFKLMDDQQELIENAGLFPLIKKEVSEYGSLSYDKSSGALKLVLRHGGARDHAVKAIEKHIGDIGGGGGGSDLNNESSPNNIDNMTISIPSVEVLFPLTSDQLRLVTNEHHLKMLMDDMSHFGSIGVNEGVLRLIIPQDVPTITPIHKLEKRLGVLMTVGELKEIRKCIYGEEKDNISDNIDPSTISLLKLNDNDFFNNMMEICKKK
eukprot:258805_1